MSGGNQPAYESEPTKDGAPDGAPVGPGSEAPANARDSSGHRRALWVGGGVAVAVAVLVLLLWLAGVGPFAGHAPGAPAAVPTVTVTAATLSWSAPSNPCFTSPYGTQSPGTLVAGGTYYLTTKLTSDADGQARFCTVENVTVTSSGFTLRSANVPLLVPASGGATLNISVTVPSTSFSGQLNVSAGVTYVLPNVTVKNMNVDYAPDSLAGPCGISAGSGPGFTTWTSNDYNGSVGFFVVSPEDACEVTSVSTNTTGFSVSSSDTPYELPVDNFGGVTFVLLTPDSSYSGNVTIVLQLSDQG
jgi:hypothetical protein